MNLLDLLLLVVVAGAFAHAFRRGLSRSYLAYAGLVAGTTLGAFLATTVDDALGGTFSYRPVVGLAILLTIALVGLAVGNALGGPLRLRVRLAPGWHRTDSLMGAALAAVTVLATAWFLGLSFARSPVTSVTGAITSSTILRVIDLQLPRPPGFMARVEGVFAAVPYPEVFDRLSETPPGSPVRIDPAVADNPAVRRVALAAVKIESTGCGGDVFGSGYPVATDYVITNAHVVAATHDQVVRIPDGRSLPATVVLFDPDRDISILHAPGLDLPVPQLAVAARGTAGATIGYPGGGGEVVRGATVRVQESAIGRDIYDDNEVKREIYVVAAEIHSGNSGGPLVDDGGNVLGMVFANSTTDPLEAYVLTNSEVATDVRTGVGRTSAAPTGSRCSS